MVVCDMLRVKVEIALLKGRWIAWRNCCQTRQLMLQSEVWWRCDVSCAWEVRGLTMRVAECQLVGQ